MTQKENDGYSIFHSWAGNGKLWPFECALESNDIMISPIEESSSKTSKRELQYPWLVQDNERNTPLDYAINKGNEEFASLILLEDKNALNTCQKDVLFKAIEKRCQQRLNALHLAPKCNKDFCIELLKRHPELLQGIDKSGNTILHKWIKIGQVWAIEYILNNEDIDYEWREHFICLLYDDDTDGETPLHVAATCTYEATHQVVMLLNSRKEIPLHLAIRCQPDQRLAYLYARGAQNSLSCYTKEFFEDSFTGQNILHLASTCTDKDLGIWLVEEAPEFITQPDKSGITLLDVACDVGATRIIEAMLEKDPLSTYNKLPLAWVKECEKGHVSVIHAFIDCCPEKFSDNCIQHHDSLLHHIKLRNLMRYEEFLKLPYMKDLINLQDSNGATPLHNAIEN
ncbi:Transient receptor potential cation channel subfamily A member 1-like protein [Bienertia sinuspersici]